jgi:hypothetical protein
MSVIAGLVGKLLASKWGAVGVGAAGAVLAQQAVPLVKPLLGKLFKGQLERLLAPNLEDAREAELLRAVIIAAIAYAEYKIPDRGQGKMKKALAVSMVGKALPGLAGQIVGDLVQEAFDSLDDEMKKRLEINQDQ